MLQAEIEDAAGPVSFAWTSPTSCTVEQPAAQVTPASCSELGPQAFTVEVSDGVAVAKDTVVIAVGRSSSNAKTTTGTVGLGLPDEPASSGVVDGATVRVPFDVPLGATVAEVVLDWTSDGSDLDVVLQPPGGGRYHDASGATLTGKPERIVVEQPDPGEWVAVVQPKRARDESWTLTTRVDVSEGVVALPKVNVRPVFGEPGSEVTVRATVEDAVEPIDVRWELDPGSSRFDDGAGAAITFPYEAPTIVKVKVSDEQGYEIVGYGSVRTRGTVVPDSVTVVGVVDDSFTPYHFDFVGHQHPANLDGDPSNDFDFGLDPATYIEGHPGAAPINVSIPETGAEDIDSRRFVEDVGAWGAFEGSSLDGGVNLYWFPGTKIVGAARFGDEWYGGNSAHGTRSAASAAGNINGTCPDCVVVLLSGITTDALVWAVSQPWIDVVTNSYGHCLSGCRVRDGVYLGAPTAATRAAAEAGQTIAFSAGNGLGNAFDVPQFTYTSSEKGPDWVVTVGANSPSSDQNYSGSGKPVDISSVGSQYPSTGESTAAGVGTHSGTSNASPVTAGVFAKVLHEARVALGDQTSGYAGGVVASGAPIACGSAVTSCALGDGVLTRAELWELVFHNVLPRGEGVPGGNHIPKTDVAFYYQGHGAIVGRLRGDAVYRSEIDRMIASARGEVAPYARPAGERDWFVADSKCRQKFWGTWSGGYYTGGNAPVTNPIASAFDAWCSRLRDGMFGPR